MNIITLDFETFFDDEYSLKKMTTEAYVRDKRFEVHGCGVRYSDGTQKWIDGHDFPARLPDLSDYILLAHHAHFDGLILSHHFGIRPAAWLDTLSMARMLLGNHLPASLEALAKHFNLAPKNVPYNLFKGKHWHELSAETQALVADGCLHDVNLTWTIFNRLAAAFPAEEYRIVDMTVRMFTEPVLQGDVELLARVWMDEERRKEGLLARLGVDEDALQSSDRFADLLRGEGIEPERKPGKNGPIYAFAKTDDFMKELAEDDGIPGDLARARLGVRSTIDQTRAERLGWMARRGALPVYLRFCGAHTLRWSGGDSVNWHNLRRGSDLRTAVGAPEGYLLIVYDLKSIEFILLNTLAGQWDIVEKFKAGVDIYVENASAFYGEPVSPEDKPRRGLGKQIELSCGYGAGADSIKATAKKGQYGPPLLLTDEESLRARDVYRNSHPAVDRYWRSGGRIISRIASDFAEPLAWGPLTIRNKRVFLPNGAPIIYDTLEYHTPEGEDDPWPEGWRYKTRQGWKKIYGAALVAETTQALARVLLSQALLRIQDRAGLRPAWLTHDDAVFVVPVDKSDELAEIVREELERPPVWLPALPVKVEGGVSERYEK